MKTTTSRASNGHRRAVALWILLLMVAVALPGFAQEEYPTSGYGYVVVGPGFFNGKRGRFEFVDSITSLTPLTFTTQSVESRLDYNTAFSIRAGGLRYFGEHWALGGEYTYVRTPYGLTADGVVDVGGAATRISISLEDLGGTEHQFAANLYYFFQGRQARARLYAMGGPALDWFFLRDGSEITIIQELANGDPTFAVAHEKDLSWGANIGGGVVVHLTRHFGFVTEGRMFWSNTPQKLFPLGQASVTLIPASWGSRVFTNDALKFNTPTRLEFQLTFGVVAYF